MERVISPVILDHKELYNRVMKLVHRSHSLRDILHISWEVIVIIREYVATEVICWSNNHYSL